MVLSPILDGLLDETVKRGEPVHQAKAGVVSSRAYGLVQRVAIAGQRVNTLIEMLAKSKKINHLVDFLR